MKCPFPHHVAKLLLGAELVEDGFVEAVGQKLQARVLLHVARAHLDGKRAVREPLESCCRESERESPRAALRGPTCMGEAFVAQARRWMGDG
jgi:hypothetical protein